MLSCILSNPNKLQLHRMVFLYMEAWSGTHLVTPAAAALEHQRLSQRAPGSPRQTGTAPAPSTAASAAAAPPALRIQSQATVNIVMQFLPGSLPLRPDKQDRSIALAEQPVKSSYCGSKDEAYDTELAIIGLAAPMPVNVYTCPDLTTALRTSLSDSCKCGPALSAWQPTSAH